MIKNKNRSERHTEDPLVVKLSEQQKSLRLQIHQSGKSEDRTSLRNQRNNILRQSSKRLRDLTVMQAESLVDTISSTDDCQKRFRAARALRIAGPTPPLAVHNSQGHVAASDQGKADSIQVQFTDQDDKTLHPFTGDSRPLQSPKEADVDKALRALNNERASGPDGINVELLKYASHIQANYTHHQLCL